MHAVAHDTRVGGIIQERRPGFYQVVKVGVVAHVIFSRNIAVADAGIARIVLRKKRVFEVVQRASRIRAIWLEASAFSTTT